MPACRSSRSSVRIPEHGVVEGYDDRCRPGSFHAARTTDGPRPLPDGSPQLADDRRNRVGTEISAALLGEAVDGLDEPDGAHLDEIVDLVGPSREASRDRMDERQVLLDHALARGPIPVAPVGTQENRIRHRRCGARCHGYDAKCCTSPWRHPSAIEDRLQDQLPKNRE
jgi:hypothetical protein